MKAAVLEALEKIKIVEKPKPAIGPEEALVKVGACGICGSDLHGFLDGGVIQVGTVMGHEFAGVIDEVGDQVMGFTPGEPVVIKPYFQCGECRWCKKDQTELCVELTERFIGNSPSYDGGFAEFVKISHPEKMLFKLPENVTLEEAALIEPLATSFHCVHTSRFKAGDRVVVIGAGPIGLGIIQILKLGGAEKIIVLQRSPERSKIAEKLGADVVLSSKTDAQELMEDVYGLTDGIGADIVFEAAGAPSAFQNAMNFVRSGGQVMVVGIYSQEVPFNPTLAVMKGADIKGSVAYNDDDYRRVIGFFNQKKIETDLFISDVISLDDIAEKGFKRLLSGSKGIKILVKP